MEYENEITNKENEIIDNQVNIIAGKLVINRDKIASLRQELDDLSQSVNQKLSEIKDRNNMESVLTFLCISAFLYFLYCILEVY